MENISDDRLNKVHMLLTTGEFEKARDSLNQLYSNKSKSPAYYYNLGVIDLKQNKLESAWIHIGMADSKGSDKAIDSALNEAKSALESSGKNLLELDPTTDSLMKLADDIPLTAFTFGSLSLFLVLFIMVMVSGIKKQGSKKGFTRRMIALGTSFLIMLTFLSISLWVNSNEPGWVLKDELVKTGPGENFLEVAQVKYGTKIRVVRREKNWFRVRLNRTGSEGYIPAESLLTWMDKND